MYCIFPSTLFVHFYVLVEKLILWRFKLLWQRRNIHSRTSCKSRMKLTIFSSLLCTQALFVWEVQIPLTLSCCRYKPSDHCPFILLTYVTKHNWLTQPWWDHMWFESQPWNGCPTRDLPLPIQADTMNVSSHIATLITILWFLIWMLHNSAVYTGEQPIDQTHAVVALIKNCITN
jgi:hypothetical protein